MAYQGGAGGNETTPLRLEEAAMGREAALQKARFRRRLFGGFILILILSLMILALLIIQHIRISKEGAPEQIAANSLEELNKSTESSPSSVSAGCEATILLSRHCEKEGPSVVVDKKEQHCSYIGHERAHYLATKFGTAPGQWPVPSYLYALSATRGHHQNFREIETLLPLANQHSLEINSDISDVNDLVDDIHKHLADGDLCGRTVLVSWNHEAIATIATALGCSDCPDFFPDEFDPVWQLKFVYDILGTSIMTEKYKAPKHKSETGPPAKDTPDEEGGETRRQLGKHLNHLHVKSHHHRSDNKQKYSKVIQKYDETSVDIPSWTVFSFVTAQGFDPLAYSASVGDYVDGGAAIGGQWMSVNTKPSSQSTTEESSPSVPGDL